MSYPLILIAAFSGSALVTFALTPLIARLARRLGVLDHPGGRKLHGTPTPKLGGIAIFGGLLIGVLTYGLVYGPSAWVTLFTSQQRAALIMPCTIVFLLGVLDDFRGLAPSTRIAVQTVAALICIQEGYVIDEIWTPFGFTLPLGLLAYPVTLLWFIGVTNAFNLIDGLDGLLPSVGTASLLGCAGVALLINRSATALLGLTAAGALIGFLPWNWHKARIFLGSSGSLLVGFLVAALALRVSRYVTGGVALHVMLALCALPAIETFLSMGRRYVSGKSLFSGDSAHIHHVLVTHKKLSVQRTVIVLAFVQVLFSAMALASRMRLKWYSLGPIAVLLVLAGVGIRWLDYVELRVAWHHFVENLFTSRRRLLAQLTGVARAGESVRRAGTPSELCGAIRDALADGPFSYVAIEFSELGGRILGDACPVVEVKNEDAAAYSAGTDRKRLWLFSIQITDEEDSSANCIGVTYSAVLFADNSTYGRLVCHCHDGRENHALAARHVHRYLVQYMSAVLAKLEDSYVNNKD